MQTVGMLRQGLRRSRCLQDAWCLSLGARAAHNHSSSAASPAAFSSTPLGNITTAGLFPAIRGLLVDAAGTLLIPSEPAAKVYLRYAIPHMPSPLHETEVLQRFRA